MAAAAQCAVLLECACRRPMALPFAVVVVCGMRGVSRSARAHEAGQRVQFAQQQAF